ncbi:uncharacterized protein LOC126908256 [Daktulosphaira vitifoliae]|uniref:uncharacterized protein LOC126908256 n=1 Tax=Daktulosphaira vitifoliae TaxID=58002 RepID=UPI0021AA85FA|nr:uncharacterized protein LOC126908256 [Daktulosphaira vitifoliae]
MIDYVIIVPIEILTKEPCYLPEGYTSSKLLTRLSDVDISVSYNQSPLPSHNPWYRYGILVDLSCYEFSNTMLKLGIKNRLFDMQNDWVLYNSRRIYNTSDISSIVLDTFETHLSNAYILPDSNVYMFINVVNDGWEIWEGFRTGKEQPFKVFKCGKATADYVILNNINTERRNLKGIILKATTVISEPDKFIGFYPFVYTNLDVFSHMHNELNLVLQDQLNFKMELSITNDFGWDYGNGTFSGMIGKLQREEDDFGGHGSFIRADRMVAVDYTVGTFYRDAAALYRQPSLSSVYNICILPFKFDVWLAIFCIFLGFIIVIICLNRITKLFDKNPAGSMSILDSIILVHGAICQQGFSINLNSISLKISIFVLFVTTVFLFTSYAASIVALLQSPSNSIKTVEDIVESSMTFSAQISPYSEPYFEKTDDPLVKKLFDNKMKPSGDKKFTNATEGLNRIQTEFHGFVVELITAYKLIGETWHEKEKCGLSSVQFFKIPILALAVIKKSGYKDLFKQKLIQQQEVGIKNRIIKRWVTPKPACESFNRANQFVSVSIKDVYLIFQIFLLGIFISVLILALEKYYFKKKLNLNTYLQITWSYENVDDLFQVLHTFFIQRHVPTITFFTCWPTSFQRSLLLKFSSYNISISFHTSSYKHYKTWYRQGNLVDLSCDQSLMVLENASRSRNFNMQNDWVLIDNRKEINIPLTDTLALATYQIYLEKLYILPDSGVFFFIKTEQNYWEIWNGFRPSNTAKIRVFKIGKATTQKIELDNLNSERMDFGGITLKATTVIIDPEHFYGFNVTKSSDLDYFAHINYAMSMLLSNQLNFKINISYVNDYGWSAENGSFGGLTGMLEREEIDFSLAGVFIRPDRMNVIDYTLGTVDVRSSALFKQPPLSSINNIFVLPFDSEVWIAILITFISFIIIIVVLTFITDRLSPVKTTSLSILETILIVYGSICQQGAYALPNTISIRLTIFIMFFTAVFLYTSYSACIVALLQSASDSIKTVRDIVESEMTFSAQSTQYSKIYFNETEDTFIKRLYEHKMKKKEIRPFTESPEGIERIRTEFHGFMVEQTSAYNLISKTWRAEEKCGLSDIELFKLPPLAVAVVKKSGHLDIFKQKLIQQYEVGVRRRILNQWSAQKPTCTSRRSLKYVSVSIKDIYPILKIFGYGILVSVVILFLEIINFKWKSL